MSFNHEPRRSEPNPQEIVRSQDTLTRHLHDFHKKECNLIELPRQGERGGTEQEFKRNELIIVSEIREVVQNKKEEQKRGTCSTLQEKEGTKKKLSGHTKYEK